MIDTVLENNNLSYNNKQYELLLDPNLEESTYGWFGTYFILKM